MLPIAATQPDGEATRLDSFRAELTSDLLAALGLADGEAALAEALDSLGALLFQNEPFRLSNCAGALRAARRELGAARRRGSWAT